MAQQTEPVKRLVAVKLIKAGMDSKQVLARFEAERQALALMDHPNIARVFDAGATAKGRPYFVMELVKGVPLTRYCDEHRLSPKDRLELFVPVCQAIQHAHQKGIIHRDIKPSNVLVALYDGRPVPKVIDFGIAKATGQQLTEHTLVTGFGTVVGTLEYMSPEQAELNQLDIDTRSDVYSLGVLLYELLTGTTPLERKRLKEAAILEVLRLIREEEPPRPSTRLSESKESLPSISAQRQTEPAKLTRLVRGELDWLVMKALEKDRSRRYETANGFAMDVQRYLANEPVLACPPSAWYRLKKFARRNRGPVVAATLSLLLLVGGIVGTTLGLLQAQASEGHAQNEALNAGRERDQANAAREAETTQRNLADDRARKLRRNLYFAEMTMAAEAAQSPLGFDRVAELTAHWVDEPELRGWEWYYLHGLCHRDLLTIPVMPGRISSVTWSPDGTRLATLGAMPMLPRVFDAVTGKESVTLAGPVPYGAAAAAVWSPNGKLLAAGYLVTGQEAVTLSGLWSVSAIIVWDAATGERRLMLAHGQPEAIRGLAWAPDSMQLASAGDSGIIHVWDVKTGKKTITFKGHTGSVRAVGSVLPLVWSGDGKRLFSADTGGLIKVWDTVSGKESLEQRLRLDSPLPEMSFSPDGTQLVTVSNGVIKVWDTATAKQLLTTILRGWTIHSVSWAPDGKRLGIGTGDGQIKILDATTGTALVGVRGHSDVVATVSWRPDGTRLASASWDGTVKVWDVEQKDEPLVLEHEHDPSAFAWSRDGTRLASGYLLSGAIKIWDAIRGKEVVNLPGHKDPPLSLAWSPNGLHLASAATYDGTVKIWDTTTGKSLTLNDEAAVSSVAWNPDGTRLASATTSGTVTIWDPQSGKKLATPRRNIGNTYPALSWSPDGKRLAWADCLGKVEIWDTAAAEATCVIEGAANLAWSGSGTAVAWCPAGRRLAYSTWDRTVKIWDTSARKELLTLRGHTGTVASVSWSPDGARLASASCDGTVKLWDTVTGQEVITLKLLHPNQAIPVVAWSPDGVRLAATKGRGITSDQLPAVLIFDAAAGYRAAGHPGQPGKGAARNHLPNP
jgi:WD40 repeat protein